MRESAAPRGRNRPVGAGPGEVRVWCERRPGAAAAYRRLLRPCRASRLERRNLERSVAARRGSRSRASKPGEEKSVAVSWSNIESAWFSVDQSRSEIARGKGQCRGGFQERRTGVELRITRAA